jgi:hydrogenase-4 component B
MTLLFFCCSLILFLLGGIGSLACGQRNRPASFVGSLGSITGGIFAAGTGILVFAGHQTIEFCMPWSMPGALIHLHLDSIAALFLFAIGVLSASTALFGSEYLAGHLHGKSGGIHWFFFNLLVASMVLVVTLSNNLLFLLAWEIMSLASFFLVMFDHDQKQVRSAGWMYLVTTHIGMAFLLLFFLFAQAHTGSSEFNEMAAHGFSKNIAGLLFVFALIGFGSKAGLVPFHVWLPEAHPAAPSHVSALMSGVMIKMGIYGIVRAIIILGPPASWWGYLLIVMGSVSGILGVLYALGQHDLKRLLAYHSVENIGIITLGLGCGVVGTSTNNPMLALLGYSGALLHVVNHALFKGLLFLSAGSVLNATGTAAMDALGGLLKRMPATALFFLIGSIAICGIPPLNGFVSEFLIYCGAFNGIASSSMVHLLSGTAVALSLALIGGLALACFAKAFGIVFLGEPRTPPAAGIRDPGLPMVISMAILSSLCVIIGLGSFAAADLCMQPAALLCSLSITQARSLFGPLQSSFSAITITAILLILLIALLTIVRRNLLAKRNVQTAVTWDCGYLKPSGRMQYTSTSFAQPLTDFFRKALAPKNRLIAVQDYFPQSWSFSAHINDFFLDRIFTPFFHAVEWTLNKLRWLQGGKVHVYILYIALTIIILVTGELLWRQ